MSSNDPRFPLPPRFPLANDPRPRSPYASGRTIPFVPAQELPRHRYWLHLLLLLLTLITTSVVGADLATAFATGQPMTFDFSGYTKSWNDPSYLLTGLPFSLSLLVILMSHEMGHFLTARYYNVNATLPYFLPAPSLIGTLGAFIRIRSVIVSKRVLFDIGIAGPLAGFVILLPLLTAGVALSKVIPGVADGGDLIFGNPLLIKGFESLLFPGVPEADLYLHPMARAAWGGLLATALNLMPIGQLDGGHILYSVIGEKSKWVTRVAIALLVALGYIFGAVNWYLWAALLFFFGMRHPSVVDQRPIGQKRTWLALLALAIFVVSFTPVPIR